MARKLARRFLGIFESAECIVCPSGSCTAMVRKHYPELLAAEPVWLEEAQAVGEKIFEASQFLTAFVAPEKIRAPFPGKVTYHDSCHSSRSLGIYQEPRALLAQVKGWNWLKWTIPRPAAVSAVCFPDVFPKSRRPSPGKR